MFDLVIPRDRTWLRHVAVGLSILSLITLTIAFAKPKGEVYGPARAGHDRGHHRRLAVDDGHRRRSRTGWMRPRSAAEQFVNSLPPKFNVALVSFAGSATTLVPPTLDRGAVTAAIQGLQPQPSTAIGEGIYTSLAALNQVPPDPNDPKADVPGRIVLLSDGKTQVGPALRRGRPGRSGPERADLHDRVRHRGRHIKVQGRDEPVPVDKAELARVSRISGGQAYTAGSAGELREVYKDIGSSVGKEKVDQEVTSRYAGFGLGLRHPGRARHGRRWRPLAVNGATVLAKDRVTRH